MKIIAKSQHENSSLRQEQNNRSLIKHSHMQ
jgi:hypothetical protein